MTPVGIWAFWQSLRDKPAAIGASYAYAAMNLIVLGHYLYAWPWEVSPAINGTILLEAATAAWLFLHTISLHRALARHR
jgi:hypothetical protein